MDPCPHCRSATAFTYTDVLIPQPPASFNPLTPSEPRRFVRRTCYVCTWSTDGEYTPTGFHRTPDGRVTAPCGCWKAGRTWSTRDCTTTDPGGPGTASTAHLVRLFPTARTPRRTRQETP